MSENKNIPIFTGVLAKYLLKKGLKLVDIAPNKNAPRETVFYFERTDKVWEAIKEFKNQKVEDWTWKTIYQFIQAN